MAVWPRSFGCRRTSRLQSPDQTQIINDFFQGGVIQTEGRRWLQLFHDPNQQEFIYDFLTGGVVQMVRNRLLDETTNPGVRDAIIAFFPDEVTDYRGGPITMIQRRLIAAAKGNTALISLVNLAFDNPVVLAVRHLIGGGPLIGTPLNELPPLEEPAAPASIAAATTAPDVDEPAPPVTQKSSNKAVAIDDSATPPAENAEAEAVTAPAATTLDSGSDPPDEQAGATVSDVVKTGNKVSPTTVAGGKPTTKGTVSWGVFGQVAESIVKSLAGKHAPAGTADTGTDGASGAAASTGEAGDNSRDLSAFSGWAAVSGIRASIRRSMKRATISNDEPCGQEPSHATSNTHPAGSGNDDGGRSTEHRHRRVPRHGQRL